MPLGRQKDHSIAFAEARRRIWAVLVPVIARRRQLDLLSASASSSALIHAALSYTHHSEEVYCFELRRMNISRAAFSFNFNVLSDLTCLALFRFKKADVLRMLPVLAWPEARSRTARNRYSCDPILVTCVILRRLASPARWVDMELLFGRHGPQLSEIFWEGLEEFNAARQHLITNAIDSSFMQARALLYAEAVHDNSGALSNCVGFIDGTVICIARPVGGLAQNVAYNGHKRKHAMKFQALTSPDGLILHASGPVEGREHDWTMYVRSGLDECLGTLLFVDGKQHCIYGDSGYNWHLFMEVPYQGSNLTAAQKSFNEAMSRCRVNVEWMFKEIKMYWTTTDFKRKMRVGESPVGMLYYAAMLLSNFRNCVYPNTVSQYFRCAPPSLETYVAHKEW